MMDSFDFTVYGTPRPQGSKKHVGKGIMVETNKGLPHWRGAVSQAAAKVFGARILDGPISARLQFVVARPKGHYGTGKNAGKLKGSAPLHPTSIRHGDLDKLQRAAFDAITGVLIRDDSQVVHITATREYGEPERASIHLHEIRNG